MLLAVGDELLYLMILFFSEACGLNLKIIVCFKNVVFRKMSFYLKLTYSNL